MSEPDTLTQLVVARFMQPNQQDMLKMLLVASMHLLCKTPVQELPGSSRGEVGSLSWVIGCLSSIRSQEPLSISRGEIVDQVQSNGFCSMTQEKRLKRCDQMEIEVPQLDELLRAIHSPIRCRSTPDS